MVAYEYPPVGGIGVQRVVKLAKYLPDFGIEPIILSCGHTLGRVIDHEVYVKDEPQAPDIIRIGGEKLAEYHACRDASQAFPFMGLPWMLYSTLAYSDLFGEWYRSIKYRLGDVVSRNNINAVWTTSPYFSTNLIGARLNREYGLPWMMDVRDSRVGNSASKRSIINAYQEKRAAALERKIISLSSSIITVSDQLSENMISRVGDEYRHKFRTIPNGYDPSDFEGGEEFKSRVKNPRFTLIYAGSFPGTSSPVVIVNGVNYAIDQGMIDPNLMRIDFYGKYGSKDLETISAINSNVQLSQHGFVSRRVVIEQVYESDLPVIVTVPGDDNSAREIMTSKVFEYLAQRKYFLAATDASPLRHFIISNKLGMVCGADDYIGFAEALSDLYRKWATGESMTSKPSDSLLKKYSRREQAGELAEIVKMCVANNTI